MEDHVKEQVEYYCECGRRFIIPNCIERTPRKCPRCARMMFPELPEDSVKVIIQPPKKKNLLDNLEETLEYDYKFDGQGQRLTRSSEPFSLLSIFRKLFSLLSFRDPNQPRIRK